MVFQLPHHFEALRCMTIERLWDGHHGREPMHDLIGDIMKYCRRPVLTLDCPTERFVIDHDLDLEGPSFTDCGNIYQLRCSDKVHLYNIDIPSGCVPSDTFVSTLCPGSVDYSWTHYYDEDTRKLYVLYNRGHELVKYDMASGKAEAPIKLPVLASYRGNLHGMIIVGDCLHVATEYLDDKGYREYFRLLCVHLTRTKEVRIVHEVLVNKCISSFNFTRVKADPQAIQVLYRNCQMWYSVRIDVMRMDDPMLFSIREDEVMESQQLKGFFVDDTIGLDPLLMEDRPDSYVLRRPDDYKIMTTIAKDGKYVSLDDPIIFYRWNFGVIRRVGVMSIFERYHPYLM